MSTKVASSNNNTINQPIHKSNLGKGSSSVAVAAAAAKKAAASKSFTNEIRKENWDAYYADLQSGKARIVTADPQTSAKGGMFVEYGTVYSDAPGKVFKVMWRTPSAVLPFGMSKAKEDPEKPKQNEVDSFNVCQQIHADYKNEEYAKFLLFRESLISQIVKDNAASWHESLGRETKVKSWDDRYMEENFNSVVHKGKKNPNTGEPYPATVRYKCPSFVSKSGDNQGQTCWVTSYWDEQGKKLPVPFSDPKIAFPNWCHGAILADANNIWFQKTGISAPLTAMQLRRTAPPRARDGDLCDIGETVTAVPNKSDDMDTEEDEAEERIPDSPTTPPAKKQKTSSS